MAKSRQLMARVGLDTGEFETGLKKIDRDLRKLGDTGKIVSDALKGFAAVGAAAAAATAALTAKGLALADRFDDMGKRLGVSTGVIAELSHVARMSGLEIGDLEQGLTKLAKTGPVEQQLVNLADKIASASTHSEKARLAIEAFGEKAGPKLLPMLADGSKGLEQMREEARKLGLTLNDVQAKQIADVNDAFDRLKSAGEGVALQLAATLAPTLTAIADGLKKELGGALDESGKDVVTWGETVGDVIAFAADAASGAIKTVSTVFNSVGQTLGASAAAAVALFTDGTDGAKAVFDEWANDQSQMWKRLASDTNFRAYRDELKRVRDTMANAPSGAGDGNQSAPKQQLDVLLELNKVTADQTALEQLLFDTVQGFEEQKLALRQQEFEQLWTNLEAELEVLDILDERRKESTQAWIDNLLIEVAEIERAEQAKRDAQQKTVDSTIKGLSAALNAVASHSKKRFEQAKLFSKAEAALNAYRAIQQVWADEQLPFYAKLAATAVTAASTAANISAINSTQYGGGTTPSAAATPTVNGAPVQQQAGPSGPTVAIKVVGESFSRGQVRGLIEQIAEELGDGATLQLA
jgi:hypothetical protein